MYFLQFKKYSEVTYGTESFKFKKSFELNNPNKDEYLKVKNDLLKLRNYVEKNFEFVGDKFADKVRQVYYDKNTKKKIYGTTTSKEREELKRRRNKFDKCALGRKRIISFFLQLLYNLPKDLHLFSIYL